MNWLEVAGLILLLVSAGLILGFALLQRRSTPTLREIPAFENLKRAIGMAVEEGSRLHVSLGRGHLTTMQSASAFSGLTILRRISDLTAISDRPPIATSGDGALAILSQDTFQAAHWAANSNGYHEVANGRLAGLTPFSYAAGAIPVILDEQVSANVLMGNFGAEIGLLTEAAERKGSFTLAASDNLPAQTILYLSAKSPLIGEELYAASAYIQGGPMHNASLRAQDVLRWLILIAILVGAFLHLVGLL